MRYPWGEGPLTADEILTAGEVAELLGLRQSTVENYARRGLLPSLKLGKHRRFIRTLVLERVADLVEHA